MFTEWTTDLRHAARALRRTLGFTTLSVGTLALAIGALAGMFGVVDSVLIRPLPFAHPDRLVYVAGTAPGSDMPDEFAVSNEFYLEYREQSRLLEDVAIFNSFTATLRTDDRVERIRMSWPTNSLYSTLGARPQLGRLPVPEDESNVAVISDALWRTWFGRDSNVIGKSYEIAGLRRTVVGVMGPEFRFPTDNTMLWISAEVRAEGLQPGQFGTQLVARMAPGTTVQAVASELTSLSKRLPERFGGTPGYAGIIARHHAVVRPLLDELLGSAARSLWVLLGAAAIVLVIACANVANLFLVRAEGRHRELAVRRAIGATARQLVRLQMTETLLVAAVAGVLAVVLAAITLPLFLHAAPPGIPRLDQVGLTFPTLLLTLVAVLVVGLVCGAVPALRASSPDLHRLREGGRGATGRRHRGRDGLVVGQTALALVLLIGSGLLVRSFRALRHVDPGYSTRDIFTFQFAPEQEHLSDGPAWARFHLDFLSRLSSLPGVTSVGLVENVPLNESTRDARYRTESSSDPEGTLVNYTFAAGDYFRTMGISLLAGRPFEVDEQLTKLGSVVVSKSAATLLWPGQDPVGKRVQRSGDTTWSAVVGVVNDVRQDGFRDTPQAVIYYPLVGPTPDAWAITTPAYVVKTARAEVIAPEIRALIREVAPEAPMYRVFTMAGLAADSMVQLSFTMLTLGVVSGLALILGAVGLYGVLSYVVAERTREIGVRMALGATSTQVRRMVVAQGSRVVAVGIAIGVAAALAATRALGSLLFGVAPMDPATFAAMSAVMIVIGLLASYLPARRASSIDPIESLRSE